MKKANTCKYENFKEHSSWGKECLTDIVFYKTCRMCSVLVSMQQVCKCNSHAMQGAILLCTLGCRRHKLVHLHVATIAFTAFALGT